MQESDLELLIDLSSQQRNLLLMRPIFAVDFNKGFYKTQSGGSLFENLDTFYLSLMLLDYLMEGASLTSGRTTEEMSQFMLGLAKTLDPGLSNDDAVKVADIIAGALDNRSNNFKEFEYPFFDAPSRRSVLFKFQLVNFNDLDEDYRFQLTSYGYLVYLGMLDLAPEDAAELMEKMLQILIQRGKFDEALDIAKRARTLTIEYRQSIRDNLNRAQRSPGQVNWSRDLAPRLDLARGHVQARQTQDQLMMQSVRDNLLQTKQTESRRSMVQLLETIENASLLRSRLLTDVSGANDRYMKAKEAVFRVRKASNLPDLESKLLPDLMQLRCSVLADESDELISSLYPCHVPQLYDMTQILKLLTEKRKPGDIATDDQEGELIETASWRPNFPPELVEQANLWVRNKLARTSRVTVEELLREAETERLEIEFQHLIALLLLRCFATRESLFAEHEAHLIGKPFRTRAAAGDSFEFRREGSSSGPLLPFNAMPGEFAVDQSILTGNFYE